MNADEYEQSLLILEDFAEDKKDLLEFHGFIGNQLTAQTPNTSICTDAVRHGKKDGRKKRATTTSIK